MLWLLLPIDTHAIDVRERHALTLDALGCTAASNTAASALSLRVRLRVERPSAKWSGRRRALFSAAPVGRGSRALLDSEITAPLDSTPAGVVHPPAWRLPLCMAPTPAWRLLLCMAPPSAWRLPLYKAPSSLAFALCKASLPLAPALCKAPSPRHERGGTPSDTRGSVCHLNQKPTSSKAWRSQRNAAFFLISLMRATSLNLKPGDARCASRSAQQDRRRALRVLFGTDDTRCVTRSVRRTEPHTNTPPTAHSQRPARHLHRDPSISYYQRSASAT